MLTIQTMTKGALTLKPLRDQFYTSGLKPRFFYNLTTAEKNLALFASYLQDIDVYLYYQYGDLMTMDDGDAYKDIRDAWWHLSVENLNRIFKLMMPTTYATEGYNYNPLENYSMNEGTTALHSQGTLHVGGSIDDKPHTSVNYTTTQDSAASGRMEGYTISGQGSSTTPTANATIGSSTDTNYTADATLAGHDGTSKTANVVDVITHDRTGNIGVMSSQDMANQEIELRKKNFLHYFCELFIKDCTSGTWDGGYEM